MKPKINKNNYDSLSWYLSNRSHFQDLISQLRYIESVLENSPNTPVIRMNEIAQRVGDIMDKCYYISD